MDEETNSFIEDMIEKKEQIKQRLSSVDRHTYVLKLRNDAANQGVEMTPDEVDQCLSIIEEIISDE